MADRLLLRGGAVVSMDPDVGNLPKGDILIEGDKIVQIAPNIQADAQVIDVTGDVVIPGFIDTHRHTWECAIRGCAPNATLDDYFVEVLDTFAPIYRPEDVYASNLAGALECINAGITTLLDWSHINNTPEHPDAGVRGLQESGIRGVYAYGSANLSLNDYWNQSKIAIPKDDVRRVRDKYFSSTEGLLTMQLATRGPGFCMDDVCTQEWKFARELGLPITVHVGMGRLAGRFAMIKQLQRLNLLGSDTTYIHCCYFNDEEWQLVKDTGGKISIASQIEMQMGHGQPPIGKSLKYGLRPSLSIDVVTTAPGDMFTNMRSAFAAERVLVNAAAWQANTPIPENTLTARGVLEMATTNGAYTVGRVPVEGWAQERSRHVVRGGGESNSAVPPAFKGKSEGFRRWAVVAEDAPAVHTGFAMCTLEARGWIATHVHSYEESVYILEGEAELSTSEGVFKLRAGDYGLIQVAIPHSWRASPSGDARWAQIMAPQPRSRFGNDTFFVDPLPNPPRKGEGAAVDVRDPRTRSFGHIEPFNMDVSRQTQDQLAVSASMRTALLVYSGITVKMMIDSDLGAQRSTRFMVPYGLT